LKTLRKALQGASPFCTATLFSQDRATVEEWLRQANELAHAVDAVQIPARPSQHQPVSPLALAALLLREHLDPVPHLDGRDRNRIALQSDLLGMRALGVSSLLVAEPAPGPDTAEAAAKPVYDVSTSELVTMAESINGEAWREAGHEFLIGIGGTVRGDETEADMAARLKLASDGARFLQLAPCFDLPSLREYMAAQVEAKVTWQYSVIVTLAALPSAESVHSLRAALPGCRIPDSMIEQLDLAVDSRREGIRICAELIREVLGIPGVSGINLLTLDDPEAVVAAIRHSGCFEQEK
jgi:methylenetetrahydrofolate reductase (NADPH)